MRAASDIATTFPKPFVQPHISIGMEWVGLALKWADEYEKDEMEEGETKETVALWAAQVRRLRWQLWSRGPARSSRTVWSLRCIGARVLHVCRGSLRAPLRLHVRCAFRVLAHCSC